ncbi:MAG TPA: AIM24 family protein [Actinomycetales bacterium]|nr:AIM24 family protein [Actinomycetales bacterium]
MTVAFEKVNSKVVKTVVPPGGAIIARRGAMLFYTGEVQFSPHSGGAPGAGAVGGVMGMAGRAMQGEHVAMMAAHGSGEVCYGHAGLHVTVIDMTGGGMLTVEADRLLCHDHSLQSSVVFLGSQGGLRGAVRGAMTGQGLFTTQLTGSGSVAVLSHGGTIELPVNPNGQTVVDPQAYVGHTGQVDVDVSANVGWRDAVGKGSGEAIQLKLTGQGTVYVQASEQKF